MVTRVVGECNGSSIIFSLNEEQLWTATVPAALNGEYIVGLYAYDEAGNESYLAKMLFAITGHDLSIKMIEKGYAADVDMRKFLAGLEAYGYIGDPEDDEFETEVKEDPVKGDFENRGYIGHLK